MNQQLNMRHTITEKNKMIKLIRFHGYQVTEHVFDGTYTVTDPANENGWKMIESEFALEETIRMIAETKVK